jgi:tRNA A-37 threonylcarbamoyl transferase component Bud32
VKTLSVEPGTIFARDFLVERALAEGGMGAVYVARQISTGRLRALKLMQPELVQNDDLRRRFLLEAKIGASIASEHVVDVQVAGIDDATEAPFLVMELLDGVDLATHLERSGPLAEEPTRELFRQLCHALALAHQAGIVHRDLKPANVFLAKPKRAAADAPAALFHVKVLDFGIAKMTTDATAGGGKTGMIGTPLWMAPEQAGFVSVTPAADVWALGLILYTCMTGRSFWRSAEAEPSLQQIMREMLFDPIPRAGVRAAEQGIAFPPALESVIARSITRVPEQRLRDAGAFFAALEDALAGKPAPPLPSSDRFALELEADARDGPALELAVTPGGAQALGLAATLAGTPAPAGPLLVAPVRAPAPLPAPERPLLSEGRRVPWWLVYLVPLAVVGGFAFVIRSAMHASQPDVRCRLCTVESGISANGPLPLRELRHDIETSFPELDALCIHEAGQPGRAKLQWAVEGGDVAKGATVAGGGSAGMCLLGALTRRRYPILLGENGFGRTDITYTLEWNPSVDPTWSTPQR